MDGKFQKVKDKIESFDKFLTEDVFNIYGREYVTTAMLLAYCSPLRFYFQGQLLDRGWLDVIVFGDTRCGKTQIAKNILRGVRAGEFFSCENATFAGLIGGLQQVSEKTKWDVVWGKVPMNTGKLLIADEMSNLSIDEISSMSSVRSSGIAEITKVQAGKTKAQTRMIWLSNPRDGNRMDEYTHGIVALKELIGRIEDIARFDFAVAVKTTDVPLGITNKYRGDAAKKRYDFDGNPSMRMLVRWAWGIRPSEVKFTDDATKEVLRVATELSGKYSSRIPLVEPNEERIKVARVAAAVAVRVFSAENWGLVVLPEHVEYANYFMQKVFDSPAMGYDRFSESQNKKDSPSYAMCLPIKNILLKYGSSEEFTGLRSFHMTDEIGMHDLSNIFNITIPETREMISVLLRYGGLAKKKNGYRKTGLLISITDTLLKEIANGGKPNS